MDRDELLRRVDLASLLDRLSSAPAQRHGPSARWRCIDPGHADETPSISMFRDHRGTERWRCWSGGHSGTAIDAVMIAHRLETRAAMDWLADYARMPNPRPERPQTSGPPPKPAGAAPDGSVTDYAQRCARWLWTPAGRTVREWLHERGLGDDILHANLVGADPGPRRLARPKGLPAGGEAATFPALTPHGEIVYVQARYLAPPPNRSKYDNPAAALAANPRCAWTRATGETSGPLVLCEGIPDALMVAQVGVASVGILGATYPDKSVGEQIAAERNQRKVMIAFDNDPAGSRATSRLVDVLDLHGIRARVICPPEGLDVSDWVLRDPSAAHTALGTIARNLPADSASAPTHEPQPMSGLSIG